MLDNCKKIKLKSFYGYGLKFCSDYHYIIFKWDWLVDTQVSIIMHTAILKNKNYTSDKLYLHFWPQKYSTRYWRWFNDKRILMMDTNKARALSCRQTINNHFQHFLYMYWNETFCKNHPYCITVYHTLIFLSTFVR